jgi:hypothetical protein
VKAIKSAKFARRYAIIALIENKLPLEKKDRMDYNKYDIVLDLINQYLSSNAEKIRALHFDNFYKVDPSKSINISVSAKPGLEKIPEFNEYFKGIR